MVCGLWKGEVSLSLSLLIRRGGDDIEIIIWYPSTCSFFDIFESLQWYLETTFSARVTVFLLGLSLCQDLFSWSELGNILLIDKINYEFMSVLPIQNHWLFTSTISCFLQTMPKISLFTKGLHI